jgi:hypothetical protein
MMEVNKTGQQSEEVIPPVMRLLETEGGYSIFPLCYDRTERILYGIIDDYIVSGNNPAPIRRWSLTSGRCDSNTPSHTLKENNALSFARNIPLRQFGGPSLRQK